MRRYMEQLLDDIRAAAAAPPTPWFDSQADEEDEMGETNGLDRALLAPWRSIEDWTGISKVALPPADRLTEQQQHDLLEALKDLLGALRCHVVFQQTNVPLALQYSAVREGFDQQIPLAHAKDHFFAFCQPGQDPDHCLLGQYCECRFLDPLPAAGRLDEEIEEPIAGQDPPGNDRTFLPLQFNEDWFGGPPLHEEDGYLDELEEEDLDDEDEEGKR